MQAFASSAASELQVESKGKLLRTETDFSRKLQKSFWRMVPLP
jgi:hypothetical protein